MKPKICCMAWSKEEDKVLKKLMPYYFRGELSREDLLKVFPSRTWHAITIHSNNIGLKCPEGKPDYDYLKELQKRGYEI